MNNNLTISRTQAAALARLIRHHLATYNEATGEPDDWGEEHLSRKSHEPFTGADLDTIEPLLSLLEKLAP